MTEMASKFDELIAVQGHPVFKEYRDYLKDRAMIHAEREFVAYKQEVKRLSA